MRYRLFQGIGSVSDILEEKLKGDADVQPVTVRNLLTVSHDLDKIEYRVYGMHSDDINGLSKCLKEGKIPSDRKKEVLLGSYASRYYQAGVGDKLNIGITLEKENDNVQEGMYVVSGILSDNADYFKGAIILSKEDWCEQNGEIEDNAVFIYLENEQGYQAAVDAINGLDGRDAGRISVANNYFGNSEARKSFSQSVGVICIVSMIVIVMLFFFLMRGMSKKIGLLKALGLPEKNIITIFCGGLFAITMFAVGLSLIYEYTFVLYMNYKANEFYGYPVREYSLNGYSVSSIVALNLINMLTAAVTIIWLNKKVSPRDAMLKS